MSVKIFNRIFASLISILFICTSIIKIHSVLFFPAITNWNYHQLQKIDVNKKEFSFAVFGDNRDSKVLFENLIKRLNKEDILFAIDNGDLVSDGQKEKFGFFINQIRKLNKPLLTVIGNHELIKGGRANYYNLFGNFYYSFAVGNSYFIILDNANEIALDPWQMDWLANELRKSQAYKYRFVFMHVPLFEPKEIKCEKKHSLKDSVFAKKLNDLFDKSNITMLFVSHIHGYYRGVWGQTPYIITGGAGARLAGSNPQYYFYHYIKVDVSENGVKYKVVKLENPNSLVDKWIYPTWIRTYSFLVNHFECLIIFSLIYLGCYLNKWIYFTSG